MNIPFKSSRDTSFGMEMEFQLLDLGSFNLVNRIVPLLKQLPDTTSIQPEYIQNTVEIASEPCTRIGQLDANVRDIMSVLMDRTAALKINLSGAGTHPFSTDLAVLTPLPRYQAMERYGYTARTQVTFATHVHIGVRDANQAITLMHDLKPWLPLLIALAANSPYWRGVDTNYATYRRRILAASRTYGQPPDFDNWTEFSNYVDQSQRAGVFESIHDIHWDIRPRPHLGTVEVRAMDGQSTVTEAVALAAFLRLLVEYLMHATEDRLQRDLQPVSWWVHKDNCFLASRDGIEATVIAGSDGHFTSLQRVLDQLIPKLKVVAQQQRLESDLFASVEGLLKRVELGELGYQRQRKVMETSGCITDIVQDQCEQLQQDLKSHSRFSK